MSNKNFEKACYAKHSIDNSCSHEMFYSDIIGYADIWYILGLNGLNEIKAIIGIIRNNMIVQSCEHSIYSKALWVYDAMVQEVLQVFPKAFHWMTSSMAPSSNCSNVLSDQDT